MEEKFRDTFNQLIDENENELRQNREEVRYTSKINTIPITIMVICGVIAFMGFFIAEQTHNVIGAIIGVIALGICFGAVKRIQHIKIEEKDEYNEIYQNKIIKPLMKLFYNEPYTYMPLVGIPREVFEGIEYRKFNRYTSSNLIVGTIRQGYEFKMANVVAINSKYRYFTSNDVNKYEDYTVFNGVLVEIELKENFNHYLYLKSKRDILSKDLNEIRRELKLSKNKLKKSDIKEYNVYTSNEKFAEEILSKDIVSKLLEYSNMETGEYCEMAIKENFIYLIIPNIEIPGTRVTLYEDRENMYQELWEEYKKFGFAFELSNFMIDTIVLQK
ncbi:MAG: DUF3137 domain-containing protein [Clostridia bacterium]|nr:DUF3137 domain-containing protein [Clostridia bacterium]